MNSDKRRRVVHRGALMFLAAIVLAGFFAQLSLLVRLSGQNRQLDRLYEEVQEIRATRNNLAGSLNQYQDLGRIRSLAEEMGMVYPSAENTRVIWVEIDEQNEPVAVASSGVAP